MTVILRGVAAPPEEVLGALPREPDRHIVVVAARPPLPVGELAEVLGERLPVGCRSIRLVLSHAGHPEVAQPLAEALRIEVVAPTGAVILLPGGQVFVTDGSWASFRPGQPAVRYGARHPAPGWEPQLAPYDPPPGLRLSPAPAGLWLHDDGATEDSATEDRPGTAPPAAVLSVPVDPERPAVVIGRPEAPPIDPELACLALEPLTRAVRRRLVLVPYGPDSVRVHRIGQRLAVRTGGAIEVVAGVPDTGPGGEPVLTTTDQDGRRGWRPFGERFLYRAAAAPQLLRSRPLPVAVPGLAVEVVRAGLWLHGEGDPDAERARLVPADAHPLIVLGSTALADLPALPARLDALVRSLPAGAVPRLVVTRPPEDGRAGHWRELTARYGPLLVVVGDGELAVLPDAARLGTGEYPVITPRQPERPVETPPETPTEARPEAPSGTRPEARAATPPEARAATPPEARAATPPEARAATPPEARAVPVPPAVLVPAAQAPAPSAPEAGADDAARLRELLGDRFAGYLGTVDESGLADAERAALAAYLAGDPLLAGPGSPPPARSCLLAGVTRLRVRRGPVFAGGWVPPSGWEPGQEVAAADLTRALAPPGVPDTAAPAVLAWSVTGRRIRDSVVFLPGTRFRVLVVEGSAEHPELVLLRELPSGPDGTSDDTVRESLRRLAAARSRAVEAVG